jgi:protein-tyrosine-phosphatase/DNA-binding transcriptional ArsR family regulator
MNTIEPRADSLAALGHPTRLAVFRLLARRAPQAVPAGEIAAATATLANTLSKHLDLLVQGGLATRERLGRSILYGLNIAGAGELVAYLVGDCCRARPDIAFPFPAGETIPMPDRTFTVLFVCTGNSARSIFAEAIMNRDGNGRFRAYSSGTAAYSELNPRAIDLLQRHGYPTAGMYSKNVSAFQGPDAPKFDFVFTVCDRSANEECPPWPGQPISAHWGVPDPVKVEGTDAEKAHAFNEAFRMLRQRIHSFMALPIGSLDRISLQRQVDAIGLAAPDGR